MEKILSTFNKLFSYFVGLYSFQMLSYVAKLSYFIFMAYNPNLGEGNGYPLKVFVPGEFHCSPVGYTVHEVAESDMTKWLTHTHTQTNPKQVDLKFWQTNRSANSWHSGYSSFKQNGINHGSCHQ